MTARKLVIPVLVLASVAFCGATGVATALPMPAWSPLAATGPTVLPIHQSEIQTIGVKAKGGTFALTFEGQTTNELPYNASAGEVQAAINGLATVGGVGGSVTVQGGPGGIRGVETPYVIAFGGTFVYTKEPAFTVTTNSSGSTHITTLVEGGPGTSILAIFVQNVGGAASSGPVTVSGTLPSGVRLKGAPSGAGAFTSWTCNSAGDAKSFTCSGTATVKPGTTEYAPKYTLEAEPSASGTQNIQIEISGGGAVHPGTYEMPLTISDTPASPGIQSFSAGAYNEEGNIDSRAGAHPFSASTGITVNTVRSAHGELLPAGEAKNIKVELPPGFLGNPAAVPACPLGTLEEVTGTGATSGVSNCPRDTIIGVVQPSVGYQVFGACNVICEATVENMSEPFGHPGAFRFHFSSEVLSVTGSLKSDGDYGIDVESPNTPQLFPVYSVFFTFWGNPASPSHDSARCVSTAQGGCGSSDAPEAAFLTNPVNCSEEAINPPVTTLVADTWALPELFSSTSLVLPPVTGCQELHFDSEFTFRPNEVGGKPVSADSPSGFDVNLTVPPDGFTDPSARVNPEVKTTVVKFPKGVVLNPSAADGLGACAEAQIGLEGTGFPMPNPIHFNKEPNTCPESSKIGAVEIKTPLLATTLQGNLYLAKQSENPFGSLFAVYLVIEDPRHGIFIKLPGKIETDATTGQITSTFDDLPQVPFESLTLHIAGGSRAPLATPITCGTFTTDTEMVPWSAPESGPPSQTEDSFSVNSGPDGSGCVSDPAQRPFAPSLLAGSSNTAAGAHALFTLSLSRKDGEQEFKSIEATMPEGFTAALTGVPYCPQSAIEAAEHNQGRTEQASPSCPVASEIGTLAVGTGVGANPYYVSGNVYLAGPYEGAPFSLVFVTPAVAGPFDLGDVVVRGGIYVDPKTAQITVKSDPLPHILDGVPLQVRSITAEVNRANFALNPTSCETMRVATTINGSDGAVASPSTRFQVGGCAGLAFKPAFKVSTSAKTSRSNGASLTVRLGQQPGEANIHRVKVELPKALPSRLTTLQKACTEQQFNTNPAGCPSASKVGTAVANTPILPVPLAGPAYFVSHGGAKFPELILVLQGDGVTIDLAGETFISEAGVTSSTFATVPDAPVSSFELNLPEGPYSALAANGNICTQKLVMPTEFVGQNGKQIKQSTKITVTGCAKTKTLTRAQKLKAALKACRKLKNKTKRQACVTKARKRYGAKSKKAKKGAH